MKELKKPDELLRKILPAQTLRPDSVYVLSQFALPFAYAGRHILYNSLTRQIWEIDHFPGDCFTADEIGNSEDLTTLMKGFFLVPKEKDECAFYDGLSRILRALKQTKGIRGYTILPTSACNARCIYCYEEGMQQVTMTPETADQTVQYILRTKEEGDISICWFGGEPLLGETVIDRICEGLTDAGVSYTSGIITNGSLLTENVADKMAGLWRVDHVQLSMDGAEPDYIARKRYISYRDTYRHVIQSINLLTKRDIQVCVRCNVDEVNFDGVPQFLSDLSAAIPEKEKVRICLAPLNEVRMGENDLFMWRRIIEAEPLIREAGFLPSPLGRLGKSFRIHHCMADAGNVIIMADKSLYCCEHCPEESRFGDVADGITHEAAKTEFCRTDRTREKCRKCPFLPVCTSFSSCPVKDTHCRERRLLLFENSMEQLLEAGEDAPSEEQLQPVC